MERHPIRQGEREPIIDPIKIIYGKKVASLHASRWSGLLTPAPRFAGTFGDVSGDVAKHQRDIRNEPGLVMS
jgi:hypothetical protein